MGKLFRHPPGYPIRFKNPSTGEIVNGQIIDEVWLKEPEQFDTVAPANKGWREGAPVVQLIQWPTENNVREVRFTYYVRSEGEDDESWRFGGQYALSIGLDDYRHLLAKLQDKAW